MTNNKPSKREVLRAVPLQASQRGLQAEDLPTRVEYDGQARTATLEWRADNQSTGVLHRLIRPARIILDWKTRTVERSWWLCGRVLRAQTTPMDTETDQSLAFIIEKHARATDQPTPA